MPQDDWEQELNAANWREVIKLAGGLLAEQDEDLQAAVWLGEALIAQHGLDGAHGACELLAELMDRYWDEMYPRVEDDDLDERAGKLAWFNDYAAQAVSRSEEHTSELQSLMRSSYAVFCLKKKKDTNKYNREQTTYQ